ncbi:unnamed protein product [Albugo candida]|uniref:valine--tRNA ligase n=1 Tax=Albugo candida TaxID=65357 RepID=A0A024GRA1_9STRA|nr:unnamed protein product [Albugo candida]|eukprot:CCI49263.1 unnamed protein product [Albugo candida]
MQWCRRATCWRLKEPTRFHRSLFSLPDSIYERVRRKPLAANYDPIAVESGWTQFWQQELSDSGKQKTSQRLFSLLLPPPNITGSLHIGHALTVTIQDALIRWHRMQGKNVSWIPGLDHAGIATQSVVERNLLKKDVKRHDLGREEFIQNTWSWKKRFGSRILDQMEQLGTRLDRQKLYFTLDEKRSHAVKMAFVQLYEKGLIFRQRRMINWCPFLNTALSDVEVELKSIEKPTRILLPGSMTSVEFGVIYRIRYEVAGHPGTYLEVDTTRPETIFGDVAVAIHPQDARYEAFHRGHVIHPFTKDRIPIVLDDTLVDMQLGTVTPSHDANDFECGQRHELPERPVLDQKGCMYGQVPSEYLGLDRFKARTQVIEDLERMNLYVGKVNHPTTIRICSRSGDLIEPLLMPQWFISVHAMAKRASSNVREGIVDIEPKHHMSTWFHFLDNAHDWCISRQLWWGHRIPAYRVQSQRISNADHDDAWIVAASVEEALAQAEKKYKQPFVEADLVQDEDVLDTWFSSALLPLSSNVGGPYPLSLMETGSDILFFWVARMMMLCEELSGTIPFKKILLHPMVRDKSGRKMSKSLGNVMDPLHVIHGATLEQLLHEVKHGNLPDREREIAEKTLRQEFPNGLPHKVDHDFPFLDPFSINIRIPGRQINIDVNRVISYRHICNKIWNAVRYALPLLKANDQCLTERIALEDVRDQMTISDRWILSRLVSAAYEIVEACNLGLSTNRFASSVAAIHQFFVQDLCDVYIEFSKSILYQSHTDTSASDCDAKKRKLCALTTLLECLECSMRLLHPFAPFLTEELWQRLNLYKTSETSDLNSILSAAYPTKENAKFWIDVRAETSFEIVLDVLRGLRSLVQTFRKVTGLNTNKMGVILACKDIEMLRMLQQYKHSIESQAKVVIHLKLDTEKFADSEAILTYNATNKCQVLIPVPKSKDIMGRVAAEAERLDKRLGKCKMTIDQLTLQVKQPHYASQVPEDVQAQSSNRLAKLKIELTALRKSLDAIEFLRQN